MKWWRKVKNCISVWIRDKKCQKNWLSPHFVSASEGKVHRSGILLGHWMDNKKTLERLHFVKRIPCHPGPHLDHNSHYHHLCSPWNCKHGNTSKFFVPHYHPSLGKRYCRGVLWHSLQLMTVSDIIEIKSQLYKSPYLSDCIFDEPPTDLSSVCDDFRKKYFVKEF